MHQNELQIVESRQAACDGTSGKPRANGRRTGLTVTVLISAIALFWVACFLVPAYERRQAVYALCSQIHSGMTRADVESILAPCSTAQSVTDNDSADGSYWICWRRKDRYQIQVRFDSTSRVLSASVIDPPEPDSLWTRVTGLLFPGCVLPGHEPPPTSSSPFVTNPHDGTRAD
jgi:hypothetical protein